MSKKRQSVFSFKVIAGSLKGKMITAPDLGVTRPPLTRLRKAIFDFLAPYLANSRYLDLFSGTGSYLFEAVSRGVALGRGVELEPKLTESINGQAKKLAVDDRLQCLGVDVFEAIPHLAARKQLFDIIMIAPPQYQGLIDRTLEKLTEQNILAPDGLILCQHDSSETKEIDFSAFDVIQQRKYGNTTFTIVRPR